VACRRILSFNWSLGGKLCFDGRLEFDRRSTVISLADMRGP